MGVNLFDLQRDRICVPVGCAFSIYLQIARILHATDFVHPTGSAPQALSTPYRGAGQSPTACARPLRSRSSISPPQPWGATGERTDLNRGESHAPIRSRSTVSDGGGDTTLEGQRQATFGKSSQPPPPESASLTGRNPPRMTLSSGMTPERCCSPGVVNDTSSYSQLDSNASEGSSTRPRRRARRA